jgi:signal transduction histidine kinase/CheY-like chemotaxis protein
MFSVPIFRNANPPDISESGESYVLRDFERSRVAAIRAVVVENPVLASILYATVVLLWTIILSAGSGLNGNPTLAVNLTPHVAHYTIILGFFFYPLRLIWVPILLYLVAFTYPFYQPIGNLHWHDLPGMSVWIFVQLFGLHLASGLLVGMIYRGIYFAARGRMRPHSLDLFTSFSGYFIFALVCLGHMFVMLRFAQTLPPEVRDVYGFTDTYVAQSLKRVLRASVVVSVFLLVAVEYPKPGQYLRTLALALIFPLMVPLQAAGLVLHPQIDVVVLAMVIVLTNPAGVGIHACTFGVAAYASITGEFLNDSGPLSHSDELLVIYALVGMTLVVFAMMIRGQSDHQNQEKDAAILKLDRARDFAGVGLFAVNHDAARFRLDDAAQRMLGLPSDGPLSVFLATFMPVDQEPLARAFTAPKGETRVLVLHMSSTAGAAEVLRCYMWAERTPSGENAAFGILLDMTEAEQREAQLRDALTQLSGREEKQRQLFSIISHELRTPASVLSLLADEVTDTPSAPGLHRQMREAADQLMTVLDDMRQAVNPERNLPVKLVPYVPAELAGGVRDAVAMTANDAGLTIRLDLAPEAWRARIGDVVRVRQALTNLVRNAVIHSRGTTVTIRWREGDPVADFMPQSEWQVEDDGIGIPEAEVSRLFEPFERGSDPRKQADGVGLGLYIARSSIQMLGGALEHYRPESGGAGYVIRLPEALGPETPPAAPTATPVVSTDGPFTVVLAEDNALVAEITRARLEKHQARVFHATDGRAALRLIQETDPDLVITDLFMPEMDGDDLIRALRASGFHKPILGLTAAVVGEEMDRFRLAGANVIMRKPLDFERLRGYLRDGFPEPETAPKDA